MSITNTQYMWDRRGVTVIKILTLSQIIKILYFIGISFSQSDGLSSVIDDFMRVQHKSNYLECLDKNQKRLSVVQIPSIG